MLIDRSGRVDSESKQGRSEQEKAMSFEQGKAREHSWLR
jgi:hypothetical protein